MTDGEDLTKWQRKRVGLTTSAELVNLERDIPYAIRVAARTKVLTFMVHAENSSNCPAISFSALFPRDFSIQIFKIEIRDSLFDIIRIEINRNLTIYDLQISQEKETKT